MFNYLKKYNIFCSLKLFLVLYAVCMFSISAEAKICFLPDSSCGTGKISSVKPNPAQCLYSSMAQAQSGISSCEKAYKQNFCFYRRCKTEDNNIFADEASCKKKAKADNLICVSCGGCYKVTSKTCPSGYTAGLTTCAEKAGYTASYSSNGYAGYSVCGKCKYTIKPCESGYTVGLASCPEKQGYTSKYSRNGVSGEQVCGKCDYTAKGCTSGYTAGLTSCSERRGYNASYASNGYSGEKICGKCNYTARTCPDGYSTKYSSVRVCGYPGGWNYSTNGYSGDAVCGKCTAKTCPSGSWASSSSPNCSSYGKDYWWKQTGYSGNLPCVTCEQQQCPSGYGKYEKYGVAGCGDKSNLGWTAEAGGGAGEMYCTKCTPKACPSDYPITNISQCPKKVNGSGTFSPYLVASKYDFHGEQPCYRCEYRACSDDRYLCHHGLLCCLKK